MAYTPVHAEWENKPSTNTPVNKAALEHIEQGIGDAHTAAATAATTAAWASVSGKPSTFPPVIGTTASTALAGNTVIPAAPTWGNISGKPAVVAAGVDAAAARTAIGAVAATDNVASATKLATTRAITLTGDVTGTANFDGTAPASITAAIGAGVVVNADVSASAAIASTKVAVAADATNGIDAGTLQATLSALAARIVALETAP